MAPLILIVGRISDDQTLNVRGESFAAGQRYFHAVERAGGVPLMLPPIPSLIDRIPALIAAVDGLLLHGGGDLDPRLYGQEPTGEGLYGIIAEHDLVELAVVRAALGADLPTLAICRGLQVLNVAVGGTLVQDIGSEAHWHAHHRVAVEPGSLIAKAIGSDTAVACHCVHHQALDVVGEGIRVTSAVDGMVHAVEMPDKAWVVGTQWHPEDDAATDPQQQSLFDELVRQATR
jgi:putative glutamine amidotransferase